MDVREIEEFKATFTTTDRMEAKRLAKASDMAYFIWELTLNGYGRIRRGEFKDYPELIKYLLEENAIIIEDLTN